MPKKAELPIETTVLKNDIDHVRALNFIEQVITWASEHDAELSVEVGELKIQCKCSKNTPPMQQMSQYQPEVRMEKQQSAPKTNLHDIKSDSVGTVYLSPSPDQAPFILVGSRITQGQTLFIVEAMKVMSHLKSPVSGVVKEILVYNEQVVEYGQVLARVE